MRQHITPISDCSLCENRKELLISPNNKFPSTFMCDGYCHTTEFQNEKSIVIYGGSHCSICHCR